MVMKFVLGQTHVLMSNISRFINDGIGRYKAQISMRNAVLNFLHNGFEVLCLTSESEN